MSSYKLLVLDLDGTLTNDKKEITPYTKQTLLEAQQQGLKLVLASGRPTYGIAPLADELQLDRFGGFVLAYNGGKIINWQTKEVMVESVLPTSLLPYLYACSQKSGFPILTYKDQYILTEHPDNEYVIHEAFINKMPIQRVEHFLEAVSHEVPKCLMVGDPAGLEALEQEMVQQVGNQMSVYRSAPFFLELVPLNIDKAKSLNILLREIDVTKEQMIACGDGFNDLTMIQLAGLGVAMENAQPQVKEQADFITLSNEADGVAHVVRRFCLS